ncbi:MAG TPA: altronate dehydratase family protein, partial [Rhizomicrobium sp.]|nr:altronate dehydratase family protein [Rhizomicrobium sp.]
MAAYLRLHPTDNVVVAVADLSPGDIVDDVKIIRRIPRGHKAAVRPIAKNMPALKFGQIIGFATADIAPGEWVHEHNIAFHSVDRDYEFEADAFDPAPVAAPATFQGYARANGRFGTRNYLGILTSVNCSATVARLIAREVEKRGLLDDYPEIDGIIPLVHGHGCGMDSKGEGYEVLKRTQWGYAANPNMGGVLMVGLGCETFQIARWKQAYNIAESDTFRSLTIQDAGGTKKAIEDGIAAVRELLPVAAKARRETAPASALMLALQCGGSDGYSGITANPALGAAVDLLVAHGGTAILSETPEIYGAEHLLTRRANPEVGRKLIERIRWWEDYTRRNDGSMNNNPSPGNKAGGLTTILEKSLGAAAKGGTTRLKAVFEYAEAVTAKGFVFMDTPGYDPVSATGQVAGGANILCFTTGRGSAYGCKPTPSIKLATNTPVFERMAGDMDINCGDV